MGRRDKRKRRLKKLRAAGLLPPKPDRFAPDPSRPPEDRDPRERWSSVRLRGGGDLSLDFSEESVQVEARAGDAEVRLDLPKFKADVDLDDADAPSKAVASALGAALADGVIEE